MKAIVILAVVMGIVSAVIATFVMRQSMSDQGAWIYVAMGNPHDNSIDMVVSVELGMTVLESPKLDSRNEPKWDEWISDHFQLRGSDAKPLQGARVTQTMLVDERKAKHVPEFYIQYSLRKGQAYTLDHVPSLTKKNQYRYSFVAPSEALPPQRVLLPPVKGNS